MHRLPSSMPDMAETPPTASWLIQDLGSTTMFSGWALANDQAAVESMLDAFAEAVRGHDAEEGDRDG